VKILDKCALCGDSITDDLLELSYCPYCLSTFHFKCVKKHLFRESKCPECGKTATLLTFGHGQPRKLKLESVFEKKREEKFDEVDAMLKEEPKEMPAKPEATKTEEEREPEEFDEYLEEEEWEEESSRSRWVAVALIILLFLVIAIVGVWWVLKGSPPF